MVRLRSCSGAIEGGEIVEGGCDLRVVGPVRLLVDVEPPPVERLGVGELALESIELRQLVDRDCDIEIVRAERFLEHPERALEVGLGLAVAALCTIDGAERDEGAGETGIVGPEGLLGQDCRSLGERRRLRVLAGAVERKDAIVGRLQLGVGLSPHVAGR